MSEQMRAEFEAALIRCHCPDADDETRAEWLARGTDGEYRSYTVKGAWWGWQASREAVVAHMPVNVTGGVYSLALEDCRRCIEAAGLQVKP